MLFRSPVQLSWLWIICGCLTSCGGKTGDVSQLSCLAGTAGCPCRSNNDCDQGLACSANVCLTASGGSDAAGTLTATSVASGGSTFLAGGTVTATATGGAPAAGGTSGVGGKSCIAVSNRDAGCCGDGTVESPETCDDGINDGSYGGCTSNCLLAPYCGDGIVNGPEQCDDGIDDGSYGGIDYEWYRTDRKQPCSPNLGVWM